MIARAEEVESYFRYWPLFCGGKIKSFAYVQASTIDLAISYVDVEKQKAAEVNSNVSRLLVRSSTCAFGKF